MESVSLSTFPPNPFNRFARHQGTTFHKLFFLALTLTRPRTNRYVRVNDANFPFRHEGKGEKGETREKVGRDFNVAGNLFVVRHKFAAFSQHGHVPALFFSPHFFLNFIFQASLLVHEEIKKERERRILRKIFNAFSSRSTEFLTNHSCSSKGDYGGNDYSAIQRPAGWTPALRYAAGRSLDPTMVPVPRDRNAKVSSRPVDA